MKVLCVDVGGTSIKYGVIDEELNIENKGKYEPDGSSLETYVESLGQLYDRFAGEVDGVACSMPGIIDPDSGYFYSGGAYDRFIHEINFKEILNRRIPVRLSFENDGKAAAYAELGYGALKDVDNAILLTLGHAIGGAIIYDHDVVHGKHFSAGEMSFLNTTYSDLGFDESFAGRCGNKALLKRVQQKLSTDKEFSGYEIFQMIEEGNEPVREAFHEFVKELCVQIYNLQIVFDPELTAIGGGISAQPYLFDEIERCFDEMKETMDFFMIRPKIVPCVFGNDANMIGAFHRFNLQYGGNKK